jgi:hypothetical protein
MPLQILDDDFQQLTKIRLPKQEIGIDAQHIREQIARVDVRLGERVGAESLQSDRHQVRQADRCPIMSRRSSIVYHVTRLSRRWRWR